MWSERLTLPKRDETTLRVGDSIQPELSEQYHHFHHNHAPSPLPNTPAISLLEGRPSPTMRFSTTTFLVTALGWFSAVTAHNIQLKSHSRECFHENLHRGDRMTVSFQVGDREFGGSGNLEIDFWVRSPLLFGPVEIGGLGLELGYEHWSTFAPIPG